MKMDKLFQNWTCYAIDLYVFVNRPKATISEEF